MMKDWEEQYSLIGEKVWSMECRSMVWEIFLSLKYEIVIRKLICFLGSNMKRSVKR